MGASSCVPRRREDGLALFFMFMHVRSCARCKIAVAAHMPDQLLRCFFEHMTKSLGEVGNPQVKLWTSCRVTWPEAKLKTRKLDPR